MSEAEHSKDEVSKPKRKKKKGFIRRTVTYAFDFSTFMDTPRIKGWWSWILSTGKRTFTPYKPEKREETFEQAATRLGLGSDQLDEKQSNFLWMSRLFLVIAALIFGYTGYLIAEAAYIAVLIAFVLGCIAALFFVQFHFWYFQIKERRLGCSFKEWFRKGVLHAG